VGVGVGVGVGVKSVGEGQVGLEVKRGEMREAAVSSKHTRHTRSTQRANL